MIVKEMAEQECLGVLARSQFGHLACAENNRPYIVPISFAFAGNSLYFFSLQGQKIDWLRANPLACVHVQEAKDSRHWRSVIATGVYKELTEAFNLKDERDLAWSLLQERSGWWDPGSVKPEGQKVAEPLHPIYFSISISALSGRESLERPALQPVVASM